MAPCSFAWLQQVEDFTTLHKTPCDAVILVYDITDKFFFLDSDLPQVVQPVSGAKNPCFGPYGPSVFVGDHQATLEQSQVSSTIVCAPPRPIPLTCRHSCSWANDQRTITGARSQAWIPDDARDRLFKGSKHACAATARA